MNYTIRTETGKRAHNEDCGYVPAASDMLSFIAVSDGMGGHAAGEVASKMTVNGVLDELRHSHEDNPVSALRRAIARTNLEVYRAAQDCESLRGMGATLVCAVLGRKRYVVANVGDSRLYHFDGETIEQVTTDHSLVEMLVQSGSITREEARTHPRRNVITRAIGIGLSVDIDLFDRSWKPGDVLLLCSDGLSGSVTDERLCSILQQGGSLDALADTMVREALQNGSSDNITVALARCERGGCA